MELARWKTMANLLPISLRGREADGRFVDRPVWTTKGDVQYLNTEDDLELAIVYAGEAQDRMGVEYVSRRQALGDCFG